MQKSIFTMSLILISMVSNAAIYKCKTANGSINYSAVPCPKGSTKKVISTIAKSKQQDNQYKPTVSLDEIRTASDGLSNIRKDGYANIRLKQLKEQYFDKGKRSTAKRLTEKHAIWEQYVRVKIDPNSDRGILLKYTMRKNNQYARMKAKKKQVVKGKPFNISLMDVNVHAVRIGLKNKADTVKAEGTDQVEWEWSQDGFRCNLLVKKAIKKKAPSLSYQCKYQGKG